MASGSPKRGVKWFAVLVVVAAAGFAAWWFSGEARKAPEPLNTVEVTRGDIQLLVSATGVLEPSNYVDVGAQVSGQLETIHVRVGQNVKEGELLAQIDPTVYTAKVDATRAQLKNQQAQIADRKAQLRLAEIQFQRQQNLYREEATTRESLQTAEATLASAKAQLAMLEAQIEQTSSTLRAEEANLGYARIYAPMEGTVVSIEARQGQTLNATQQAPVLMRIADLATMRVRAQVSEADVGKLEPGMRVYFTTLGDAERKVYDELLYIEPTPEVTNNVVLYNALFDANNDDGKLLPNMTAQVFFIQSEALDVLRVPVSSVQRGRVQVLTPAGQVEWRDIVAGVSNRVHTEVVSGVKEGEKVVLVSRDPRSGSSNTSNFRGMLR